MNQQSQPDILRATILVLIIGVLLVASLWTMQAFIGPLVWATAIVVATWPLLEWVQRHVGGSRALATTVMTLVMLLIFVVPFWAALGAMLDASVDGVEVVRSYLKNGLGPPPDWLMKVPFRGRAPHRRMAEPCPPAGRSSSPKRFDRTSNPWPPGCWRSPVASAACSGTFCSR